MSTHGLTIGSDKMRNSTAICNNSAFQWVIEFRYLGVIIKSDKLFNYKFKFLLSTHFFKLSWHVWQTNKSPETFIFLMKSKYLPIVLYLTMLFVRDCQSFMVLFTCSVCHRYPYY